MHDKEAIEMMQRCIHDIRDLRRQIEVLAPKAEAYDALRDVIRFLPKPSVGYGEDITWTLQKRIQELQPKPMEPTDAQPQ
jgi:hypothetical protein